MKVSVTYDGYAGYKTVARMPDFMDPIEWINYRYNEGQLQPETLENGYSDW